MGEGNNVFRYEWQNISSEEANLPKQKEFCDKCGTELNENGVFCPNCGSRVQEKKR